MSGELPLDVLELLRERVLGLDGLKVLLLLREEPSTGWTAFPVVARLDLPKAWAEGSLEDLCAAELLEKDDTDEEPRFFYRPATLAIDATVARLAEIYEERPADVIRTLNDNALERVRMAASRAFPELLVSRGRRD